MEAMLILWHVSGFKSMKSLILVFLSSIAFADVSFSGKTIPAKIVINKTQLLLNGITYRKVSMFNVKVWLGALYLENSATDSNVVISSKTTKVIDLHALYDISASDSVKGWKLAIDSNCQPECKKIDAEILKFYSSVPDFKKNSFYRYIFTELGMQILLENKEIFKSSSPEFAKVLLKTWIGENPPSEEIKKDLLMGSAKP